MSYVQWPSQAKPWSKWSRCMNPNCRRSCYGQMCYQCHTILIEMTTAKAGPSEKSKSGDSSLPSKAPSKSVPAGPPPKAAGISVQPPTVTQSVGDQSSNARNAAEDSSPEQKAIAAVKQSIKVSRTMLDAIKDDDSEAAAFQKAEIEARIAKQKTKLDKLAPARTRLNRKKDDLKKTRQDCQKQRHPV